MKDLEQQKSISPDSQMFISMLSNTYSFDSRFDRMQTRIDEVNKNQITMQQKLEKVGTNQEIMQNQMNNFQEQFKDMKIDMDRRLSETRVDMLDRLSLVDKRFEQVDKRFEQVDKRFEQVDKRFEQVDKRFEQVDKRFEQVDKRFEQVDQQLVIIMKKMDERFDIFDKKLDKIGQTQDYRDDRQRRFTLRMFSIAVSISSLSVVGVFLKIMNMI